MSSVAAKRVSPQQLCAAIRHQVITGVLAPGQRLTEEALAAEFGTSRIPVREALRILEADGFIRVQPYYGTFVVEVSDEEAADLLEIRGVLEPFAAGKAATRCTPDLLAVMQETVNAGTEAANAGRLTELPALNTQLHGLIAEASGSAVLTHLLDQLSHKIAWVYSVQLSLRACDSWVEHQMIVDALARADADSAAALMLAHVRGAEAAYRLRSAARRAE
ncbi:GntR family transcriptional regulator [Jatrophihabitans sp. GAS493]|uniref:GntR family transcriptional regulator n=1 Tax=Jatrophihabitans sp. GAS493 TaxID=1907575 RepID=UPI000BB6E88C|nr:GntR family transcriptional regulator [Jatrophihabitans sp. GAS493]SOD70363.1 GntR family transcriptional regulator [Jatrophihabitans sp. GAS493]